MDTTSVTGLITASRSVFGTVKSLMELTKNVEKVEIVRVVSELQQNLLEMQQRQHELMDENRDLRERLRQIEEKDRLRSDVEHHYQLYWLKQSDGSLDGPFSPSIWEMQDKLLRLRFNRANRYTSRDGGPGEIKFEFFDAPTEDNFHVPLHFINEHCPRLIAENGGMAGIERNTR